MNGKAIRDYVTGDAICFVRCGAQCEAFYSWAHSGRNESLPNRGSLVRRSEIEIQVRERLVRKGEIKIQVRESFIRKSEIELIDIA